MSELARVFTIGAKKYDDNNWRKGFKWGRVFAAMMRHAWAFWSGESYDTEDGQHHLASVAWCAFALMEFERLQKGEDDRVIHVALPVPYTGPTETDDGHPVRVEGGILKSLFSNAQPNQSE